MQCCQMSCCLAADVVDLMMQRHEKCLRLASEIVLLQTVVSPARLCCTEVCLHLDLMLSCTASAPIIYVKSSGAIHKSLYASFCAYISRTQICTCVPLSTKNCKFMCKYMHGLSCHTT